MTGVSRRSFLASGPAMIAGSATTPRAWHDAAPVWHELHYGCLRLSTGKRRFAVNAYLRDVVRRTFPILPYDDVASTWHAEQRARLASVGRPTPFVDGQIAAIASTRSLTLVTAHVRDFAVFEGLEIEDWSHD